MIDRTKQKLEELAIVTSAGFLAGLIVVALLLIAGMVDLEAQIQVDPRVSGVPRACGVLHVSTTQAGTLADTNETNLYTFTLPANTLNRDLMGVRITVAGTLAANANNKTIKLYFGGTQLTALSTTASGSGWQAGAVVYRNSLTTQRASGTVFIGLGNINVVQSSPAEALGGTVLIRMTGQNGTASANDIVFNEGMVECL